MRCTKGKGKLDRLISHPIPSFSFLLGTDGDVKECVNCEIMLRTPSLLSSHTHTHTHTHTHYSYRKVGEEEKAMITIFKNDLPLHYIYSHFYISLS